MFFTNEKQAQSSKHSNDPNAGTRYVDNEVRFSVAQEFSRMEEQHARIREEALDTYGSASTRTELLTDRKIS